MAGAFQGDAFQNNAFQVATTGGGFRRIPQKGSGATSDVGTGRRRTKPAVSLPYRDPDEEELLALLE